MTRSERLAAVLLKAGVVTQKEIDSGTWGSGASGPEGPGSRDASCCPYSIRTTADGGRQITIDKGDVVIRASGATIDAALAALEAKVG